MCSKKEEKKRLHATDEQKKNKYLNTIIKFKKGTHGMHAKDC